MKLVCWSDKCIYQVSSICTNSNVQHVAGMRINHDGECANIITKEKDNSLSPACTARKPAINLKGEEDEQY